MTLERTPLTDLERGIIAKLGTASFPPATACKRFARDLSNGYIRELSEKGRAFLAFVAHRFRRQYSLTAEEWAWVELHKKKEGNNETKPSNPDDAPALSLFV